MCASKKDLSVTKFQYLAFRKGNVISVVNENETLYLSVNHILLDCLKIPYKISF